MITVTKQPIKYTPANNPVVFTLSGSSNNLVLFKTELIESSTNSSVYTGNIYPTPVSPSKASVNLTKQLTSLVQSDVDNTDEIVIGKTKNIIGYKIKSTAYGITSGGTLSSLSSTYTGSTFYTFESDLDIQNFTNDYTFNKFVCYSGNQGNFLTYQPNNKLVNDYSTEQLYFLQSGLTNFDINVVVNGSRTTNFNVSGVTTTTNEVKAIAYLSGFTQPSSGIITRVQIIEPVGGSYYIYTGNTTGSTLSNYITNLCNNINSSPLNNGYTAVLYNSTTFLIQSKSGLGSIINTYPAYMSYSDGTNAATGIFNNGVSSSSTIGDLNKMYRIQCSPKRLINSGVTLNIGDSYTVSVKQSGVTITQPITYKYVDTECGLDYVNVLFTNSLGGVDSYQFIQPQESMVVTKLNIKQNNIDLDSDNVYITDGVYNTTDKTYNTSTKYSIKVYTKELTDEETDWLNELVISKEFYIELSTGELLPVQLLTSNYTNHKKKYKSNEINQYQFEFGLSDGYIPALSTTGKIINNI